MSLVNPNIYRNLIPIKNETVLWQYMNIEKFTKIIQTSNLFFRRASEFFDIKEGTLTNKEFEFNEDQGNRESFKHLHKNEKSNTIVNCWHINSGESKYMWEKYGKKGVVIKSSLERLYLAFENNNERILHSKVRYISYNNGIWFNSKSYPHIYYNTLTPLIHKEKNDFEEENEYRLMICVDTEGIGNYIYWKDQKSEKGKNISVDLNQLIEKIIICPNTEEKEKKLIEKIINDTGFKFKVENSSLDLETYY